LLSISSWVRPLCLAELSFDASPNEDTVSGYTTGTIENSPRQLAVEQQRPFGERSEAVSVDRICQFEYYSPAKPAV